MDKDNLIAFLKGLGVGLVNSFVLFELLKLIIKEDTLPNTYLILPFLIITGIMMGIAQFGADEGIGYVGLFLFVGGYIAIGIIAIVASIHYQNPIYLFTLGSVSSVFMFWYIALGNGNSNVWLISVTGALIIIASALLLGALLSVSHVWGIIVVSLMTAINLIYVIRSRIVNGSILDI